MVRIELQGGPHDGFLAELPEDTVELLPGIWAVAPKPPIIDLATAGEAPTQGSSQPQAPFYWRTLAFTRGGRLIYRHQPRIRSPEAPSFAVCPTPRPADG